MITNKIALRGTIRVDTINGTQCISKRQFAQLTGRSLQAVNYLLCKGNKLRKLRCVYVGRTPMIPLQELADYQFTYPGTNDQTYTFDLTCATIEENKNESL